MSDNNNLHGMIVKKVVHCEYSRNVADIEDEAELRSPAKKKGESKGGKKVRL